MINIGVKRSEDGLTVFGVILLFVGPLMSWISCFFDYDDIGNKIKSLASVLCRVGIIAYPIAAIIMVNIGVKEYEDGLTVFGVILLFVGPLMSWINSFFIYGFGELIDKVCDIERKTERIEKLERLRSQDLITEEEYQQALAKENN